MARAALATERFLAAVVLAGDASTTAEAVEASCTAILDGGGGRLVRGELDAVRTRHR